MNEPGNQVQPNAIFQHADTFFFAIDQLHRSSASERIATPILVVSAFAAELYFKTLLALEGKTLPKWHYLLDLFLKLSPKNQHILERKWDLIARDREEISKNIDRQEQTPIPRDIRGALTEGNKGFEQIRYIYEGGRPFRFVLGDLPLALRRTILDLQPSWGQQDEVFLGRTSTDLIPEHLKEGTVTFWLRHADSDWSTNDKHYDFGDMNAGGHSVIVYKTTDRRISLTISGPLGRTFALNEPLTPGNERGVFVALTWSPKEVILYLNGNPSALINVNTPNPS